jgi:hypothetical protein
VVELNWVFVDRDGESFYPGGQFARNRYESSSGLQGKVGEATLSYDLRLELEICRPDCEAGCEAEECQVSVERYSCSKARASDFHVPSSPDAYQFRVRAVIEPEGGADCVDVPPSCVAVPGPRERVVSPGLVTDLQVYQLGVAMDGGVSPDSDTAHLDLEACGCEITP